MKGRKDEDEDEDEDEEEDEEDEEEDGLVDDEQVDNHDVSCEEDEEEEEEGQPSVAEKEVIRRAVRRTVTVVVSKHNVMRRMGPRQSTRLNAGK